MMSKQSIDGRLRGLEERFENELRERRRAGERPVDSPVPALGGPPSRPGSGRRPRPPPMFAGGELGAFPPCASHTTETDVRMREVYKVSGKLCVDGAEYRSQVSHLRQLGELGSGSCGHVVEMLHIPSGAVIAVKQMRRSGNSEETKRILMDLDVVVRSHDCPYIVRCLGCFVTEADVWICMELMASCFDKLLKRLGAPIPEEILGKVTVATVNALSYLKEVHGVIHRDVKPSNILLDARGNVKLCDFGISGRLVDSKAKTRSAGCAAYMAPERIDPPDPTRPDYDIRADVWSLGISLVELATGVFPYRDCQNDFEVLTRVIEEDPPRLPITGVFSPEFKSFVQQCLTKDYRDRPKYVKLLKHPFVVRSARSEVSVGAWYASLPGAAPPPPPARAPLTTVTTVATHTVGTVVNKEAQPPQMSSHTPPQVPPPQPPPNCPVPSSRTHTITNGLSPVARETQSPRAPATQSSPQTTPPPSIVSSIVAQVKCPRPFERGPSAAPAWMSRDEHSTPTPARSWWAAPSHLPGGSSSQPASLEAELGSYSPYPRRRTLETCASPPPPPARRVSADSRWRPSPAGSGNTSPIVLQRFYHQNQQRRSRVDLHAAPRHRSLSREHSTGRSPEPPPRSSRLALAHEGAANGSGEAELDVPALHERLQLHERLSEGRSQSLTRAELRNGWRAENAPASAAPASTPPLTASMKHHHDDQGWLHSLAGLVKRRLTNYVKWHHVVGSAQRPLQPTRQLSRAPRWGGAESWSVPASPLPPRAPPPRPAD